ncbi:dihydroorotate dehydrogenase [Clostridium senegalense]|uniref:dihydroorotate dehydrogenase n=1 Tax=Clostridium senegalense TaxID=1465809 RepID=UPI00028831D4|nr:dihydroorotate dehydrogenase [Clostridium senegalense]
MMNVNICGVELKNPVIAASGTFGFGQEYNEFFPVSKLGGISSKGLTINPKDGNDGVRMQETPSGMLNSVGLQNPGVDKFIEKELKNMEELNTVIIANLGGGSIEEYIKGVKKLNCSSVDMIELNISCPNVKTGGMALGIKSSIAYDVVKEVKKYCSKPLIVKLSPNAENIQEMAISCCKAGADALSLVNTFKGMAIDIYNQRPVFENIYAGLSGPAIKPIALRMVNEVSKVVDIPIIGLGGIKTWQDAIEFIMAGASAIQVGTANFIKPDIMLDIINGMENFLKERNIKNINDIRGII